MNLEEAREILGVEKNANEDEVKRKYRELTKKYHPDINKDEGAEDRFKKINEAYDCVKNGRGTDYNPSFKSSGIHYSDFHGGPFGGPSRHKRREINIEPIQKEINISFADSVWGCKREITFSRKIKCETCDGEGDIPLNNGCKVCGGSGRLIRQNGNMVFSQTCPQCRGKIDIASCNICNGDGSIDSTASIQVTIPAGIRDGNILRLGSMGHYIGNIMGFEQRTDVFVKINVEAKLGFSIDGIDVVTTLQLPLIDALKGCKKSVDTLVGQKEIEIKPKTRNNDHIIISGLGVGKKGNQKIILDVVYPDNIDNIIDLLSKENK